MRKKVAPQKAIGNKSQKKKQPLQNGNQTLNKLSNAKEVKRRGRPSKSPNNHKIKSKQMVENDRKITLKIRRDDSVVKMIDVGVGDYMMVQTVDCGVGDGIIDPNWVPPSSPMPQFIADDSLSEEEESESSGEEWTKEKDSHNRCIKEVTPINKRGRCPKNSVAAKPRKAKSQVKAESTLNSRKHKYPAERKRKKVERSDTVVEELDTLVTKKKRIRNIEKWECEICGRSYRKYYMAYHMRTHTKEKPHTCEKCGKKFAALYYYKEHKLQCIENPAAFQCEICHRNMATKHCLDEHLRTHSTECRFQCHICAKGFKQYANLANHLKTHTDLRPFSCDICGKTYRYKKSVDMHKTRFHQGIRIRYPCDQCDKSFVCKTLLKDHINRHSGFSRHKCEICGKRYSTRKILLVHMLIHQDKKPYPCTVCGKEFRQGAVLKRHMTTHSGIKPFRCDACGKQFIHRVYLVRHKCPKAVNEGLEVGGSILMKSIPDETPHINLYGDPSMVDHVMMDPYAHQQDVLHPPFLLN